MVRAKKHVFRFPYSDAIDAGKLKYLNKWVEGPRGKFWVSSVYYDTDGVSALLYDNDRYSGGGRKFLLSDLDENYKVIEK